MVRISILNFFQRLRTSYDLLITAHTGALQLHCPSSKVLVRQVVTAAVRETVREQPLAIYIVPAAL